MVESKQPFASLRERIRGMTGLVMITGAVDTGKTTLGRLLVEDAVAAGLRAAFVDADVAADTVGPPTCVGMRRVHDADALEDPTVHDLRFVGSISPQGVVLPYVVAAASLVDAARQDADLIVLDTTGEVSGVAGQTVAYHLMELCQPALVVALQRGEEMEPTVGMLRRFLSARVAVADPLPGLAPLSPTERHATRVEAFAAALPAPLDRWRVQTTVFAPTLSDGFDLSRLHGMLVGVQDDRGRCLGLGGLEHSDGVIRVATSYGDEMRGLRLGSMRIDLDTFETSRVRLRQLIFGI